MTATRPLPRSTIRITLAIIALASLLLLSVADSSLAKKKKPVFKTGNYTGTTSQGEPIGLLVEKKTVTVLYVDLRPPCYVPDPFLPPPSFAGLQADIKVKKVGRIAFGRGRKRVGKFSADAPLGNSFVDGYIKGRKAEGFAAHDYPGCPYDFDWEAKRE